MRHALIIGETGGIGAALRRAKLAGGWQVTGLSRSQGGLDITDEASVAKALGALTGPFDAVLVATGALEIDGAAPEKTLRAVTAQAMQDQFLVNAVGPALVIKHAVPLLPRTRRAVLAVLSARVGSIGDNRLGGWLSYRTAKAAVNQVVRTASIEIARSHRQAICVAVHPGTVATRFTEKYQGRHAAVPPDEAAQNILSVLDGLGPGDTGGFFDWSGQAVPW